MPELPNVEVYIEAPRPQHPGPAPRAGPDREPVVLRSVDPPLDAPVGCAQDLRRLGKRLVVTFPDERFLVFHLMIAGRLHWRLRGAKVPARARGEFTRSSGNRQRNPARRHLTGD